MEENKNNLDKVDELLESTSEERRIKFNFSEIETLKGPEIESPAETIYDKEASDNTEPETVVPVESIADKADEVIEPEEIKEPVVQEPIPVQPQQSGVCIIDETSTSVVFEEGPDISVNELVTSGKVKKAKPTGKIKFSPLQIVIMAVLGVVMLWCIMFTTDHTLAANGISPVFSIKTAEYEDQSVSYKGLGYKIQFKFDSNKNLTQACVPFWQDGPNDIAHSIQ